jgi:hypothetical protein
VVAPATQKEISLEGGDEDMGHKRRNVTNRASNEDVVVIFPRKRTINELESGGLFDGA